MAASLLRVAHTVLSRRVPLARKYLSTTTTFVSTPIFYVNAEPHIGHLYTAVLTDAYARWSRLRGSKTLFSTGTDEHGLKVQEAAEKAGLPPGVFCDDVSKKFKSTFDNFDITYDDYVRTTEPRHHAAVKKLWDKLWEQGHIYLGKHEGWYCTSDEAFLTDTQVETKVCAATGKEERISVESGHPVVWLSEENFKFRLSAFQKPLLDWLDGSGGEALPVVYPESRRNEVREFVSGGLHDLSISRKREDVKWAIPVPESTSEEESEHSIYVWLDALTNYLTVTGYGQEGLSDDPQPSYWPATCHVVGKDILRFHAVYWPAFLMAAGLKLPERIVAHGHWTVDRIKMSKSLGNVVKPEYLKDKYGVDPVRYFLLRDGGLGADGDFNECHLEMRRDSELADTLGNLFTRATGKKILPTMALPPCCGLAELREQDISLRESLANLENDVPEMYQRMEFGRALRAVMDVLRQTNRYFASEEPWNLRKLGKGDGTAAEEASARADTVLYHTLESIRICAIYLQPVVPTAAAKLLDFMNASDEERMVTPGRDNLTVSRQDGIPLGTSDGGKNTGKLSFILFDKTTP